MHFFGDHVQISAPKRLHMLFNQSAPKPKCASSRQPCVVLFLRALSPQQTVLFPHAVNSWNTTTPCTIQARFIAQLAWIYLHSTGVFLIHFLEFIGMDTLTPSTLLVMHTLPTSATLFQYCAAFELLVKSVINVGEGVHRASERTWNLLCVSTIVSAHKYGLFAIPAASRSSLVWHPMHTRGKTPYSFIELPAHDSYVPSPKTNARSQILVTKDIALLI